MCPTCHDLLGGRRVDEQREKQQQRVWRTQVFEVQTWGQVRGPAVAVKCKTRDPGIKWPQRHTLPFEEQVAADMRGQELKGVWLEPFQAMLRRKTNESLTDSHRSDLRKIVAEKRISTDGDVTKKKAQAVPVSVMERSQETDSEWK